MSAISLMGRIVQEEIDLYVGDCIRDGMFIQAVGKDLVYLWMVRDTGTDILCLSYLYESPMDAEITDTLLGRNKRFFIIANVDAANPELEVMFELTQVQAKEFIQSHNESMEVCHG